jgi:hypothetical protein
MTGRAELTSQQAQIVDTLKRQCPGFAGGKVTTLHRWMEAVRQGIRTRGGWVSSESPVFLEPRRAQIES